MRISAAFCAIALSIALWLWWAPNPHAAPTTSPETSNGMVDCTRQNGADAGEKIRACIDALPAGGGIADARGLSGSQAIGHSLRLSKAGTVLLIGSGATYTLADGATLDITNSNVRVEGTGATSILRLGNESAVRVGAPGQPLWGWRLERLAIEPAPGKQPHVGVMLSNAREGIISEVSVSGFSGPGIDVGENCWSDRSIDSRAVNNGIGYNFHGTALNAWNIRGGFINRNRIGVNFDLGAGTLQGFTISDGTQLEGNTDSAVRLVSGVMQGIFLSNVYSEIFNSQHLVRTEPGPAALKLNLLSITNGFVFSENTPPVYLASGSRDVVNAVIYGLTVRHSQRELPIVEVSGANTSVTLSESVSASSTNAFSEILVVNRGGARAVTLRGGVPAR